ncbi:ABC-2 type transport system ATP-binding protein [Flavobacterium swingsii]|jgi:ABC-2 type transport system ATP-binding protein|uniref:ABC-2 type transport system ATP-binding protein n=1 Tax=Flavobacterium swingsii TaxID=498292 RepID=A0A1I0YJA6_9FLAO|nr:ATP-binding cassette domain-containing protein [Flavobacterium swingsii]SFB12408.1 ABC-2 type transport system ATP-binding protein [Flavobacterium swingsii]
MLNVIIQKKKYDSKTVLENIDFDIVEKGIYGFVGKNGQGKTTLFKCILGLNVFDGKIEFNNEKLVLKNIAWCPTEPDLYEDLTAYEFYDFYQELTNCKRQTTNLLFDVPEDKLLKSFSTGMKKKTYLNAIFQNNHQIYILDEPFNGLDLESNYVLMNFLKEKSKDSIVLISSHILEILYANCKSIFVIKDRNIKKFEKDNFNEIEEVIFTIMP